MTTEIQSALDEAQANLELKETYSAGVFRRAAETADWHYGHLAYTRNPDKWWIMYWSIMNAHGLFSYPR